MIIEEDENGKTQTESGEQTGLPAGNDTQMAAAGLIGNVILFCI